MSVEYLIDLRSQVTKEREAKKKDNERYAAYIKSASSPSSKAVTENKRLTMLPVMTAILRTLNAK